MKKIIRSLCTFKNGPLTKEDHELVKDVQQRLHSHGFEIQTVRHTGGSFKDESTLLRGLGGKSRGWLSQHWKEFKENRDHSLFLNEEELEEKDVEYLFDLIRTAPHKTFEFSYGFNIPGSSPYFPTSCYEEEGFSLGLQPTDLASDSSSLSEFKAKMCEVWLQLEEIFPEKNFLGIDSSLAPMGWEGSLIAPLERWFGPFDQLPLSSVFVELTKFIKEHNPKPIGLCGMMLPALEDFRLAELYERGAFSLERNLFLSLHSGLGIDTYPIGLDEDPAKVFQVLQLLQNLSHKYQKPLSARFISDGKAKIGEKLNLQSPYMTDVIVRSL